MPRREYREYSADDKKKRKRKGVDVLHNKRTKFLLDQNRIIIIGVIYHTIFIGHSVLFCAGVIYCSSNFIFSLFW